MEQMLFKEFVLIARVAILFAGAAPFDKKFDKGHNDEEHRREIILNLDKTILCRVFCLYMCMAILFI